MGNVNKIQHKPKYMVVTSFNNVLYKKQSNIYQLAKSVNKKNKKTDEVLINIAFETSLDIAAKICCKTWNDEYIISKSKELIQDNKMYEQKTDIQKQLFRINAKKQFFNIVFEEVKNNGLTVLFFEEYEIIPNELKLEMISIPKRDIVIMGAKNSGKSTFVNALKKCHTCSGKEDPYSLNKLSTESIEIPVIFYNLEHNVKYKYILDRIVRTCTGNIQKYDNIKNIIVSYLTLETIEHCKLIHFDVPGGKSIPCVLNVYQFNCDDVMLKNAEMIKKSIQCFKTTKYSVIFFLIDTSCFEKLEYSINACNNLYSVLTEKMWDFQVFLTKQDLIKENMDCETEKNLLQQMECIKEMIQQPIQSHWTRLINNECFVYSFDDALRHAGKMESQLNWMYYKLQKSLNGEQIMYI